MWPNGQVYDGEFKMDECNGVGTLHYPDGKRFVGTWKDGKKHGKAHYEWPNGSRYDVFYTEGRKKDAGALDNKLVDVGELKTTYGNIAKKATASKAFLAENSENWRVEEKSVDATRLLNVQPVRRRK